jgi:exonuclease III
MKIATFNVNGINGRLPVLLRWLAESKPDIACLQELKMTRFFARRRGQMVSLYGDRVFFGWIPAFAGMTAQFVRRRPITSTVTLKNCEHPICQNAFAWKAKAAAGFRLIVNRPSPLI